MSQEYIPVTWVDETENQVGTVINKARLDQMQSAHHYADGFEEVDAVPTADPQVDYHKVVFCTADTTFYRWDGTQWVKDVDDSTLALLEAHEADHNNPHVVTKTQVGLGNVDNKASVSSWQTTPDNDHIPTEKLVKDSIDAADNEIAKIKDGTTTVPNATNATYLGSSSANVGDDLKPIKIVNGQAVAVTNDLLDVSSAQNITGVKTFKANVNIGEVGNAKNVTMVGDLTITGNITQNGSSYETHAEQVFTTDDYITMRDGATGGLATGDYSGFKIKKYDGTNDGALVVDNSGTARVGDVGDEQPLLTRDEEADMTNGALLRWNGTDHKAETNTVTFCKKYAGSATVATTAWASSGITAFPYKADIAITGITASDYPVVAFAATEATSGNYSPECATGSGTLTIYAKTAPSAAITITYMIIQDVS